VDAVTLVGVIETVVLEPGQTCDPTPFLREKKARKYLGTQDALAVVSTGLALARSGVALPPERTGLFLAVGYIPFLEKDVAPVLEGSLASDGSFSLERFAAEGYLRAHPLLAFRCLPNMPAYHVASSFDVQGPYAVLYPSAGQLYLALEEARRSLEEGRVDVALVVGVAHQSNLLVEHHMSRIDPPVPASELRDAAATLVLCRSDDASRLGLRADLALESLEVGYVPFDPLRDATPREESTEPAGAAASVELGPASPLVSVASALRSGAARVVHRLRSRDGVRATSTWKGVAS
jgi:hypothetical protein